MMPLRLTLALLLCGITGNTLAQVIYPYRVCTSPKQLSEFSGIAKVAPDLLAGINDSGNDPDVIFIDTTGKFLYRRTLKNIANIDWEELFYHNGILYIADMGDNQCTRKQMVIWEYNVKADSVIGSIPFSFAEKLHQPLPASRRHFDCEAGFYDGTNIQLFSKTHARPYTGKSFAYRVKLQKQKQVCTAYDSTVFGTRGFINSSITGAAINPSYRYAAFISCTHLWVVCGYGRNYFDKIMIDFDFDGLTQKEAVTFMDETRLVVADERTAGVMGGRMYFFDLKPYLSGSINYTKPRVQSAVMRRTARAGEFAVSFSLAGKASAVTIVLVDENGSDLYRQEIKPEPGKTDYTITMPDKLKKFIPSGYWLVEHNQVIYTAKIKPSANAGFW